MAKIPLCIVPPNDSQTQHPKREQRLLASRGQERGAAEADHRYALLRQLGATVLWEVDEPTLLMVVRLKAEHRLSPVGTIIAAFAMRYEAILVHKDAKYEALSGQGQMETLPLKP